MPHKKSATDMNRPLRVHTHAGIGDISWIYSKLVTLERPLDMIYYVTPGMAATPIGRRCIPLLKMLPYVNSYRISTVVNKLIQAHNPVSKHEIDEANEIFCMANSHLECGNRIETFIPDVSINHHYPINISEADKQYAEVLTKELPDYCLLYTSSVNGNKHWGGWGPAQWAALVYHYRMLIADKPSVLVGTEWDLDMARRLQIPNMQVVVGHTSLGTTLELIRRSTHFMAFPSGLAIMACQLHKPVLMLHPRQLRGLHNSWAPMDMIADHSFIPMTWTNPIAIAEHIANYWDAAGVIFRNMKVTTSCRPMKLS